MKLLYTLFLLLITQITVPKNEVSLDGAWIHQEKDIKTVLIFCDGYYTVTRYTPTSFINTAGGPYSINNNDIVVKEEFNTTGSELKNVIIPFQLNGDVLGLKAQSLSFKRIDSNGQPLSGAWKITKRMQEGNLVPIQQSGTRKTLKILTGTRFQWFAIDPATHSFSGSGGGTYSFSNGKYVEDIEFFSRDSSRVGASLSFDDHIENGEWHHTGLSSKGAKIYEVWTKVK